MLTDRFRLRQQGRREVDEYGNAASEAAQMTAESPGISGNNDPYNLRMSYAGRGAMDKLYGETADVASGNAQHAYDNAERGILQQGSDIKRRAGAGLIGYQQAEDEFQTLGDNADAINYNVAQNAQRQFRNPTMGALSARNELLSGQGGLKDRNRLNADRIGQWVDFAFKAQRDRNDRTERKRDKLDRLVTEDRRMRESGRNTLLSAGYSPSAIEAYQGGDSAKINEEHGLITGNKGKPSTGSPTTLLNAGYSPDAVAAWQKGDTSLLQQEYEDKKNGDVTGTGSGVFGGQMGGGGTGTRRTNGTNGAMEASLFGLKKYGVDAGTFFNTEGEAKPEARAFAALHGQYSKQGYGNDASIAALHELKPELFEGFAKGTALKDIDDAYLSKDEKTAKGKDANQFIQRDILPPNTKLANEWKRIQIEDAHYQNHVEERKANPQLGPILARNEWLNEYKELEKKNGKGILTGVGTSGQSTPEKPQTISEMMGLKDTPDQAAAKEAQQAEANDPEVQRLTNEANMAQKAYTDATAEGPRKTVTNPVVVGDSFLPAKEYLEPQADYDKRVKSLQEALSTATSAQKNYSKKKKQELATEKQKKASVKANTPPKQEMIDARSKASADRRNGIISTETIRENRSPAVEKAYSEYNAAPQQFTGQDGKQYVFHLGRWYQVG